MKIKAWWIRPGDLLTWPEGETVLVISTKQIITQKIAVTFLRSDGTIASRNCARRQLVARLRRRPDNV